MSIVKDVNDAILYYEEMLGELTGMRDGVADGSQDEDEVAETIYEMRLMNDPMYEIQKVAQSEDPDDHTAYTYRVIEFNYHIRNRLFVEWSDEMEALSSAYTTERMLDLLDALIAVVEKIIKHLEGWKD